MVFPGWLNKRKGILQWLLRLLVIAQLFITPFNCLASELIMFSSPNCSWCEAWEKDIGIVFPRTVEGKRLQLTHVDITDPLPSRLRKLKAIHYTPTFIVLDKQQEIGRITGYAGDEFFWWELQKIIAQLPKSVK